MKNLYEFPHERRGSIRAVGILGTITGRKPRPKRLIDVEHVDVVIPTIRIQRRSGFIINKSTGAAIEDRACARASWSATKKRCKWCAVCVFTGFESVTGNLRMLFRTVFSERER